MKNLPFVQKLELPSASFDLLIDQRDRIGNSLLESFSSYTLESLGPNEIEQRHIYQVADYFRYIFNNDWPEYLICRNCDSSFPDGKRFSASEVLQVDSPVDLLTMDIFPITHDLPNCPCCDNQMELFHDPQRTFELMEKRLSRQGYLSFIKNDLTGQMEGFCYGYLCSLREQFESEWENDFQYMSQRYQANDRSFDRLVDALSLAFPEEFFDESTPMFCWNSIAISKHLRDQGQLAPLVDSFIRKVPREMHDLYDIGEVLIDSKWHQILKKAGSVDVPGFLGSGETLTGTKFGKIADYFTPASSRS